MRAFDAFPTKIVQFELDLDPSLVEAVVSRARKCQEDRLAADTAIRGVTVHTDLLDYLDPDQAAAVIEPVNRAAMRYYQDILRADTRGAQLQVRGFSKVYEPHERKPPHTHCSSELVAVIYLHSESGDRHHGGELVLIDSAFRNLAFGSQIQRIPVVQGSVLLFPAFLLHESEPSAEERILIGLEYRLAGHSMEKRFRSAYT